MKVRQFKLKKKHSLIAWGLIVLAIVTMGTTFQLDPHRAWGNLLINNFYFISLSLSGALFIALTYVCKGTWVTALRRVPEAMMAFLPYGIPLMIILCFGIHSIYHWAHSDAMAHDALLQHKEPYLNIPFFVIRMFVILAVWIVMAYLLRRHSLGQDSSPNLKLHQRNVKTSAVFVILFAITFSFASYDWLMSLEPHWYSTIFSLYTFSSLFLHGIAAITLIVVLLMERGLLKGFVSEHHLHDLGKLLFAFSTFWAYIWFSQYMLIWYANIPEETGYFILRNDYDWMWLFLLNLGINWLIPFLVLMPRSAKRSPAILKRVSIVLLVGYWLDLFLSVAPDVMGYRSIGPVEVVVALGFASAFFLVVARALKKAPLVPINDPGLEESIHLHQ